MIMTMACLLSYAQFVSMPTVYAAQAPQPLQQLIDEAVPGESLILSKGSYAGPAIINKQLTIVGNGNVTIENDSKKPAIQIVSNQVVIQGLTIRHQAGEAAAVEVVSDDVTLDRLSIETRGFGIMLRDADRVIIKHNRINWSGAMKGKIIPLGKRQNGIDLYNSHDSQIENNEIADMRDGIYLENSHRSSVAENQLFRSRYGIHCMYTNETRVVRNEGEFNVTGAMIMGVRDAVVSDNSFRKQSENVNSQGILLFDVQTSIINNNLVEGNRVGMYIEQSSDNRITDNSVLRNFMGIQLLESTGNVFSNNQFIANVIEAEAIESVGNRMDGNYWDAFRGLDLDHDGLSDIPYYVNPFYQQLVQQTPAFQLFFQSPGMTFLSSLFTDDKENWSADNKPLMSFTSNSVSRTESASDTDLKVWIVSLMMLIASLYIMISMGVKRK